MTPQEHQLVDELFERLSKLENAPRDPEAERLIADGAKRAPHAVYALVQTALVQDEALKRANARIEELQAQLSDGEQPQQRGGFLDGIRDAMFGRNEASGSVPTVRPQSSVADSYSPSQLPTGSGFGSGGSFLGTAASAAAGVIGSGLLLKGIRSMFAHHSGFGGRNQNAFDTSDEWSAADDNDFGEDEDFDDDDID